MGAFGGFASGLMGVLGPKLDERKKKADEKQAELAKFYMDNLSTANGAAREEAEKFLSKYYGDKESKGVIGKVGQIFGKIHDHKKNQANQPQGQPQQEGQPVMDASGEAPAADQPPVMDASGEAPAARQPQQPSPKGAIAPPKWYGNLNGPGPTPTKDLIGPRSIGYSQSPYAQLKPGDVGYTMWALSKQRQEVQEANEEKKLERQERLIRDREEAKEGGAAKSQEYKKELETIREKGRKELEELREKFKKETSWKPVHYKTPDGKTEIGRQYATGALTDQSGQELDHEKFKVVDTPKADTAAMRTYEEAFESLGYDKEEARKKAAERLLERDAQKAAGTVTDTSRTDTDTGSTTHTVRHPVKVPTPQGPPPQAAQGAPGAPPAQPQPQIKSTFKPTPEGAPATPPPSPSGKVAAPPVPGQAAPQPQTPPAKPQGAPPVQTGAGAPAPQPTPQADKVKPPNNPNPAPPQQQKWDMAAWNYIIKGTFDVKGQSKATRRDMEAIRARANQIMEENKLSPRDVIAIQAANKADSKALTQLVEYDTMVESFEETLKGNTEIAKKLSKDYPRFDIQFANKVLSAFKTAKGDKEALNLAGQLHGIAGEWAKIVTGSTGKAAAPEGEQNRLNDMIGKALSDGQLDSFIDEVIMPDAKSRRTANNKVREDILGRIRTYGNASPSNKIDPPGAGKTVTVKVDGKTGTIPADKLEDFKKKYPKAEVVQ